MPAYERNGAERKFSCCDDAYKGVNDWNYAFCDDRLTAEERSVDPCLFSSERPPVVFPQKKKRLIQS